MLRYLYVGESRGYSPVLVLCSCIASCTLFIFIDYLLVHWLCLSYYLLQIFFTSYFIFFLACFGNAFFNSHYYLLLNLIWLSCFLSSLFSFLSWFVFTFFWAECLSKMTSLSCKGGVRSRNTLSIPHEWDYIGYIVVAKPLGFKWLFEWVITCKYSDHITYQPQYSDVNFYQLVLWSMDSLRSFTPLILLFSGV